MFHLSKQRPDWDDIVFKGRHQAYGAYQLRKSYRKHVQIAFLWSLGGVFLLVSSPYLVRSFHNQSEEIKIVPYGIIEELEINNERKPEVPEEIPKDLPPPGQRTQTIGFTAPILVRDAEMPDLSETLRTIDELEGSVIGLNDVEGVSSGEVIFSDESIGGKGNETEEVKVVVNDDLEPSPDVFYPYDNDPIAVNLTDVKGNIVYPQILRESGLTGKVYLKLLIDQEGKVIKHLVMRTAHPLFTESCLKEVYKLKFTPAIIKGKARKAWVSIPFEFKIKE